MTPIEITPLDVIEETIADVRRGDLDEKAAMRRFRRIVVGLPPEGDAGDWSAERTDAGWNVYDERRALLATVPDPTHEREDEVVQIVVSARKADWYGLLLRAVRKVAADVEKEIAHRHENIRELVASIERDAAQMAAVLKERGPNPVSSERVAAHVRELAAVQVELDLRRRFQRALQEVMDDGH